MKRNQSGFTLIEIAIVLVIIGLLLGGVLKGQELINSAKVKNLATDFKNVPIYIYGYQDKYKALPGDDSNVAIHIGSAVLATTPGTVGNGIIDGAWNSVTTTDESYLFWQHIRMAGFGPGSTDTTNPATYLPTNAVGGKIGVTNSLTNKPINNMVGTYVVCSDAIPGKFAKQLDVALDDGTTNTGSVLVAPSGSGGSPAVAAIANASIVDDQTYVVCMGY